MNYVLHKIIIYIQVQDKLMDCLSLVADTWDTDHVTLFVNTIKNIVSNIQKG